MAGRVEQNAQIPCHRLGHIDEKWPEVMFINDYAVFMGYLSMAVTGTGFLVVTWSAVVLLGGFVTMLSKEDFWSLTVITLAQSRVFEVFLKGNISNIGYSFKRLWEAALSIALARKLFRVCSARGFIRLLVFTIVLCPLFALYMFGLFISPGIALWRLVVQQDYGDTAGDSSKTNLKPALVVLYSLALLQGVLFYYKAISALEEQRLVMLVAQEYLLPEDDKTRGSISDYLREIRIGCEKDPSFARGRNLITYAANLMESSSPENYLSGARILDTLIRLPESMADSQRRQISNMRESASSDRITVMLVQLLEDQRMMINNIIGSASSGNSINKLVQMLGSKSLHERDIRLCVMRIVAHFANEICLNKIPYGIQCISSFLDNSEAHDQDRPTSIDILWKLTGDEENLWLMSNDTNGLASKIITLLVTSFHHAHVGEHDKWCSSEALPGVEIIKRFMTVAMKYNNMLLGLKNLLPTGAISDLVNMLYCERCKVKEELQVSVILVLTQRTSMDTSPAEGNNVTKRFIGSLIGMFLHGIDNSQLKILAGKSLAQLSCSEICAQLVLRERSGTVDELTKVLLDVNSKCRKSAADILKHLCSRYATDDSHFLNLKNKMEDAIPKVLKELLGCGSTAEPRLYYPLFHPYANSGYYSCPYHPALRPYPLIGNPDVLEVQEALASLCRTVYDNHIAAGICPDLIREAEEVVAKNRKLMMHSATIVPCDEPSLCCIS